MSRLVFIFFLLGSSFLSYSQNYKIDFEISGMTDSVAYLGYYLGEKKYVQDTLPVKEGRFVAQGDGNLRSGLYFIYTPSFYREFIVNEPIFSFKSPMVGGYDQVSLVGSKENIVFRDFQIEMGIIQSLLYAKQTALDTLKGKDSLAVRTSIRDLQNESFTYRKKVIAENRDLFIADFLTLMSDVAIPAMDSIEEKDARKMAQYQYYRNHYFDGVDITHPGLVRTPLFKPKVLNYFEQIIPQTPDTVIFELDQFLSQMEPDLESFRFWTVTFFTKYQESTLMGMDAVVVHMIENYYLNGRADWITDETKKKLQEELRFMKPAMIGNIAPALIVQDTSLKVFSPLASIKEEYIVLFFYDPDCGHCKKKAPILRAAYDDLQKLNTQVVAVSTSTDVDKWKEFIKEKEFDVIINAADTDYRSNFRADYNVRTTPQVYVLDKERKVIAKKLDVEQLVGFLRNYQKFQ